MMKTKKTSRHSGFTLVELIVVIAVIGILAAVSYISYGGVQNRAREGVIRSDLKSAAEILETDFIRSGSRSYPTEMSEADHGNGLPTSPETSYQYVVNNSSNPPEFCLTGANGSVTFYVTQEGTIKEGGCAGHGLGGIAAITNIATNPGAEVAGGWPSNNSSLYPVTRTTAVKRSGNQSVESHNMSSSTALLSVYAPGSISNYGFDVQPDTTYHTSVYFRSSVPHQGRIGCAFRLSDNTYTTTQYSSYLQGASNQWTRVSHICDSPSDAVLLRLIVMVNANTTQPAGTSAYIDDLMVVEGSSEYEYADGSSSGWIWNGTSGGSTSTGPGKLIE